MNRIASSLPTLALFASVCVAIPVHAQEKPAEYPKKPIRVVVGIAPGGGLDTMTRVAAQKLSERFGQTAVVDNRPGGGTVLAMDLVQQASSDGYTLLCASETLMLNGVRKRARYDVRKAFVPIVRLTTQPYVLDLPTLSESGLPGFELTNSYAFFAPAGTPTAIIGKINAAVIQVMSSPETRKVLAADGAEAAPPATPGEFKAKFDRDYAEMEKTIAAANIKLH